MRIVSEFNLELWWLANSQISPSLSISHKHHTTHIVFVYTKTPVLLLLFILITHSLYIQHTNYYSWQYSILPFVLLSIFCVLALRYLVLSILHHVTILMSTFPDSICKRRSWLISLFTKTKFF